MLCLYGLSAFPQDTCYVDELGVRRKKLTKSIQIVPVPSRCDLGDNRSHMIRIALRRQNAVSRQASQHGDGGEHGRNFLHSSCHGGSLSQPISGYPEWSLSVAGVGWRVLFDEEWSKDREVNRELETLGRGEMKR
jgi:hypothetical protein